jgi:hypothetical protein
VVASRTSDDSLLFFDADLQRPAAVTLTLDEAADTDMSSGLAWRKGGVPSRVTASWPGGEVAYTDTTRPLVDDSIETCAYDQAGALDVATAAVNSSQRLRLDTLVVDLASASNDLWAGLMGLEVGNRIRVTLGSSTGQQATHFGVTYVDLFVTGWVEHYAQTYAFWELYTVPADSPAKGITDDATYASAAAGAGAMTATAGTLSGTAGVGTVVVTTLSGPTLSTAAGSYPCDFNFGGERVTVTAAPGSTVSPQTVTVTARGVAPSIGRTHSAGESWDVWAIPTATW